MSNGLRTHGEAEAVAAPAPGGAREMLWRVLGRPVLRLSFHNWYGFRRRWLALFGAQAHPTARIRPSARISRPWNLTIGAESAIGDHAILDCSAPIALGERCTVSQHAHLCTRCPEGAEPGQAGLPAPIRLEDDAWVATDAFIGPGVTIGARTVVGARSTVRRSLPPGLICVGDEARPIAPRVLASDDLAGLSAPGPA